MEELSIIIGVLVLVMFITVYDKMQATSQCNEHTQYYDRMYYQNPVLNTVEENSEDLNNKTAEPITRLAPSGDDSKPVEAMWNSRPSHNKSGNTESFDDKAIKLHMRQAFKF